jgi:hypothetical protein
VSLNAAHTEFLGADSSRLAKFIRRYWATLAIFAIAAVLCANAPTAGDVSWLISLNEKVLAGKVPYIDFIEVNPPASILLYTLPVWLAQAFALRPEFVVALFIFAAAAVSLSTSAAILSRAKIIADAGLSNLTALFALLLLVLPSQLFGQREHIALIAFMPALCVYWLRGTGNAVSAPVAIFAGLGAALIVIIKPHMVFAILFCAGVTAYHARSWRPIFAIEHWLSAVLAIAYGVFVVIAYPAFVADVMPMVMSVYVPIKAPLGSLLIFFATPVWIASLAAIFILIGRRAFAFPFLLLLAASIGFSCSYYIQQKGWAYHAYPMLALALAALVIAFVQRWPFDRPFAEDAKARFKRIGAALGIALLAGVTYCWFSFGVDMRALVGPINAAASKPKVLSISGDLGVGHPLTRQVGGTWVSQVCGLWMTAAALVLKNTGADEKTLTRAQSYAARERLMLLEDIRNEKPEIILVDRLRFDWLKWANADAEIARELESYRRLDEINDVLILRRK